MFLIISPVYLTGAVQVSRIIFYGRVKYLNLEGNVEFNTNNKWKIVSRTMK